MKAVFIRVGMLPLILLLAACALPLMERGDGSPHHTYLLEWSPASPARMPVADAPSLLVSPPRAAATYAGSDMLYLEEAHELGVFAYHHWADSPAHMLEPLLLAATEHSGLFRLVAPAGTRALTDLRLDTQLLHLRQAFGAQRCHLELAVRVDLVRVATGLPLGGRVFSYREPCDPASPQGGVAAANRATARFLEALGPALRELLAT